MCQTFFNRPQCEQNMWITISNRNWKMTAFNVLSFRHFVLFEVSAFDVLSFNVLSFDILSLNRWRILVHLLYWSSPNLYIFMWLNVLVCGSLFVIIGYNFVFRHFVEGKFGLLKLLIFLKVNRSWLSGSHGEFRIMRKLLFNLIIDHRKHIVVSHG